VSTERTDEAYPVLLVRYGVLFMGLYVGSTGRYFLVGVYLDRWLFFWNFGFMSRKSSEGGRIYNPKIKSIFFNCMKISNTSARVRTYTLLQRLINKPQ